MMMEIILAYLGQSKHANGVSINWNHPNYTSFIRIKGTPLDPGFQPSEVKTEKKINGRV